MAEIGGRTRSDPILDQSEAAGGEYLGCRRGGGGGSVRRASVGGGQPAVVFPLPGLTERHPTQGDGYSDFQIGTNVLWVRDDDGYIVEADVWAPPAGVSASDAWKHNPCEQRDDSCTPTGETDTQVADVLTHELGHGLGLADLQGEGTDQLTMNAGDDSSRAGGYRGRMTLGLGDFLGVRALYPCGCPLPPIYSP